MTGWLLAQLPQAMVKDRVIGGFVHGCEEVADSVRDRMSTVEHALDVDLASPEMLSFVAAWLGVPLDTIGAGGPAAREAQRKLIRAVGQVLGWRGTRRAVETLLEALTGGRAEVSDSGGVFGQGDPLPPEDDVVRVVLDTAGGLSERQILAFLAEELPVTARVEVQVRSGWGGGGGRDAA
jgi:phage tail-like protein